ncbi:hypothetical protein YASMINEVIRUS_118 [Yasminevirus sp. GU-2018]|uniref:Uncharacterized protein n=1 Tax=Yasminevirus sp. GU-2018 TaxID=2420051 RepID=A0A5K0U785_9VIRU|nr:hypothetical protein YASMINEVIRUS_118 [Yasminevirus sp. GU-2018]
MHYELSTIAIIALIAVFMIIRTECMYRNESYAVVKSKSNITNNFVDFDTDHDNVGTNAKTSNLNLSKSNRAKLNPKYPSDQLIEKYEINFENADYDVAGTANLGPTIPKPKKPKIPIEMYDVNLDDVKVSDQFNDRFASDTRARLYDQDTVSIIDDQLDSQHKDGIGVAKAQKKTRHDVAMNSIRNMK